MRTSLALLAVIVSTGTAAAELQARVKVANGQSLYQIARKYDCSVADLKKANRLGSSTIHPGQTLKVPVCGVRQPTRPRPARRVAVVEVAVAGQSVGRPWKGSLRRPTRLPGGRGYLIRRPLRAYGTAAMVATIRDAIARVRDDHPELHTLAIGDLSAIRGGWITEHSSHQSGRDVDIGFYFRQRPAAYPQAFARATPTNLDRAATWDLLVGFARTADDPAGVQAIFLDYQVQGLLYEWAQDRGVDERYLDRLFQYPHGIAGGGGLVRHEPHHDDHMHVRFRCPPRDRACQ